MFIDRISGRIAGASAVIALILTSACRMHHGQAGLPASADDSLTMSGGLGVDSIDALHASPGNYRLLLENDSVRVLEYTLKPGEQDKPHTHPAKTSYVVAGGRVRVYPDDAASFDADEKQGETSWGAAVGRHHVENIGKTTVKIILTEIK